MTQKKRAIIITTINQPTAAVKQFGHMECSDLIIVGDKKTPNQFDEVDCEFLSVKKQSEMQFRTNDLLPYNHYSRKNIGFLYAITKGYEEIYETDDDNFPLENWASLQNSLDQGEIVGNDTGYVNIYSLFTDDYVWPRGYPLELLRDTSPITHSGNKANASVWQGLVNDDPDVDAIYRLVIGKDIKFSGGRYVLARDCYTPFNSQNTLWRKEAFIAMYLPMSVTFRFTDILRSYVAKRLLNHMDLNLGFVEPAVKQIRNEHDLMQDFSSEIPMYRYCMEICSSLDLLDLQGQNSESSLRTIYQRLFEMQVVDETELLCLESWILDFKDAIKK